MTYNYEINRELRELNNEKAVNEHYLDKEKQKYALLLKNEMGNDIKSVLNGEKKVKLSFFEKMKYKLKFILDKIFNIF